MNCSAFNRGRSDWRCERFDYRGFRLGNGKRETVVAIPKDADLFWMRRAVESALAQLNGKGKVAVCKVGKARKVSLSGIRRGFVISRGTTTIQFESDPQSDAPPRLRCAGLAFKLT